MTKQAIQNKNTRTSVLSALVQHGSLTRTELIKITSLSRATISYACADLIQMTIIKETSSQPSTGGRPAISLQFAENTHAVLGIEFQRSEQPTWLFSAFDLAFNTIKSKRLPADIRSQTLTLENLKHHIRNFIAELDVPLLPIMGLGLPGLIDSQNGVVMSAPELNWQQFDIINPLQEAFGWNISVLNNFKAHGLYECRYGEGKNASNLIYIGVNQGIGGSLFQNKKLVYGRLGGAGELGHMTIHPEGPLCSCGNKGCLEILAAAPAIEKKYHQLSQENKSPITEQAKARNALNAWEICEAANHGDKQALAAVRHTGEYLGIAMANLVNIYNPQCFILGGFVVHNCSAYVTAAEDVMRKRSLSPLSEHVDIHLTNPPQYGGALGATHEALEQNISFDLFKNMH